MGSHRKLPIPLPIHNRKGLWSISVPGVSDGGKSTGAVDLVGISPTDSYFELSSRPFVRSAVKHNF